MVDRVPRYTVDCSTVAAQHSNGLISPHMKDVNLKSQKSVQEKLEKASDLVVFRARGDEGLVKATKAAVDGVEALGDPHKLPNKGSGKFAQIKNN